MTNEKLIDPELVETIKGVLAQELADVDEVGLEVLSQAIAEAVDALVFTPSEMNLWADMFLDAGAIAAGAAAMVMGQAQASSRITSMGMSQVEQGLKSYQQRIDDEASEG